MQEQDSPPLGFLCPHLKGRDESPHSKSAPRIPPCSPPSRQLTCLMHRALFNWPHFLTYIIAASCLAGISLTNSSAADLREEQIQFAGVAFRVVRIAPEKLQVVWKDAQGQPYRTFGRVQAAFKHQHKALKFIMNAGIFEVGGIPCGLHIETGKEAHPINLADAPGNFFLKPNGVLWIEATSAASEARIASSPDFVKRQQGVGFLSSRWIQTAVQSGPLLLIDGKRHPAFTEGSQNRLHRNGVGVDGKGQLVFAITAKDQTVNFWDFAGLFLSLGCRNALFLDGDISQMAVNPSRPVESNQFGAMFVVAE